MIEEPLLARIQTEVRVIVLIPEWLEETATELYDMPVEEVKAGLRRSVAQAQAGDCAIATSGLPSIS